MEEKNKEFNKKKSLAADFALLLVALLWGGGFVAVKDGLKYITPFYMLTLRFALATLLIAALFMKKTKKIRKKDVRGGTIVGLFLFAGFALQTVGLQFTTAGKQAFLTGSNVVIVPFLVWIFSKKYPGWHSIVAAFLALIGIALLTLQGGLAINLGDSLTLLCAVFFAGHIVSVGHFAVDIDPIILTIVQLGVCSILCGIGAFFFEPVPAVINKPLIIAIGYLVVFSTGACILIQNVAQKFTPSTHAAIILCLEAVFGSVLAVIILGEVFTIHMVLGCVLIFISIIISETKLKFLPFMNKQEKAQNNNTRI